MTFKTIFTEEEELKMIRHFHAILIEIEKMIEEGYDGEELNQFVKDKLRKFRGW